MTNCVVVIRLNNESDVLGILDHAADDVVRLEHPFTVFVNGEQNTVAMYPYCSLSDETFYEFKRSDFKFLVTASNEIASKFMRMVDSLEQVKTELILEEDSNLDQLEAHIMNSVFIEGNNTKH